MIKPYFSRQYILNSAFFLLSAMFFTGCSRDLNLNTNENILYKQKFTGNENITNETLEGIIPISQKPVNRPLNLPITPKVWWINFGMNSFNLEKQLAKKDKYERLLSEYAENSSQIAVNRKNQKYKKKLVRIDENLAVKSAWFWRTIGQQPSIISPNDIKATAFGIKKFYFDSGFRDAEVDFVIEKLKTGSDKIKLTYKIFEGTPYTIDTVKYSVKDSTLAKIISSKNNLAIVQKGQRFNNQLVEAEKSRLEFIAKNNGYYNFSSQYIQFGATNSTGDIELFKKEKKGTLVLSVLNPENYTKHNQYKIQEVAFKSVNFNIEGKGKLPSDTLFINDIEYISNDFGFPLTSIDIRIFSRVGNLFKINEIAETQKQIGILNQFAFVSYQVIPLSDSTLRIEYFAPTQNKYSISSTPGLQYLYNGNANFTGFILPISLRVRNVLKRFEIIELSALGGIEGQPSPLNVTQINGSLELGANATITFPSILFPTVNHSKLSSQNPRTAFSGGFNYSEPFWGRRLNFNLKTNYSWQPSATRQFSISLLDVNLINTIYNTGDNQTLGKAFYDELVRQQQLGNNLKVTFDPQFVSSINATYLFNNQNPQDRYGSSSYFRIFAESGGTVLNFLPQRDKINIIENVFPLNQSISVDSVRAYFQFLKINVDFRKYLIISNSSGWAYRLNIGAINPYGANKSVPFNKNFFIGGSNSVRAWSPLSLGVGSAEPNVTTEGNVIPQPGDILIESSIEFRKTVGNFFGDIQLATFLDAGNIWKWNQIPTKIDQANFELNRFYKELALGTGFGIRYDLTYFLFRFDWGIKVIDPARPIGERFVLDNFSLKRNQPYGLQLQFGIGYPF